MKISLKNRALNAHATIVLAKNNDDLKATWPGGHATTATTDRLGKEAFTTTLATQPVPLWLAGAKGEENESDNLQAFRALGSKLKPLIAGDKCESVQLNAGPSINKNEILAFVEGMVLAHYQFLTYKSGDKAKPNTLTEIGVNSELVSQPDLDTLMGVCTAVYAARDLVNEPVVTLTATEFGNRAKQLGQKFGFSVDVKEKAQIETLKMGGLLGVNKGSVEPPVFMVMEYKPANANNTQPFVLVGKGVVYDTGGYNIKTDGHMLTMKCDMGGGAAVIGTLCALAATNANVHVIGLVPATDNRIDGKALVADDVITMMDGTTIEIQNTDAEGRLILGDALHFAKQYNPQLVIDLATLTGAAASITGHHGIVMCGTDTQHREALKNAGNQVYERIMDLPLWKEYSDMLKSEIADLRNIGGPVGGALSAGAFLKHFTNYPWLHLDIAGPAYMKDEVDYRLKGGTGVGVRLLFNFLTQSK